MATLDEAIKARVQATSGLYSLIGGATTPRFYAGRLPQNPAPTYPAVAYRVISEERMPLPTVTGDNRLARPRVQISAFAKTRTAAWALADAIVACFSPWKGTSAAVVVQGVTLDTRTELPRDPDALVWQVPCDFFIWYQTA